MYGFVAFTAVAAFAHFLVWMWRPWFPGVKGYASLPDSGVQTATTLLQLVA
jgi:light-harvesting complex 1 beta chain